MKLITKSLLEGYGSAQLTVKQIIIGLAVAALMGILIFIVHKLLNRKETYSLSFGISLAVLPIVTTSIILAIQNSLVVSLGMVGALSIVRFRTAIKDAIDLIYLFWAISMGIICGSGLFYLAFISFAVITIILIIFKLLPITSEALVLTINYEGLNNQSKIEDIIKKYTKQAIKKASNVQNDIVNSIYEIKLKDDSELLKALNELEEIKYTSIVETTDKLNWVLETTDFW